MSGPLRFGVVGLGFGASLMLHELLNHPDVDLVAAADPRDAARSFFERDIGGTAWASADEMIARARLDAVYVASPSALHAEHVLAATAAGLHVVVEKPMAISDDECTRIQDAVRAAGVHLVCGHTHMFDPPIVAMAEVVRSGELGAPTQVTTLNYTDLLYRPRADWELDGRRGGGVVFIQGPHQVDIIRRVTGRDPASVRAITITSDPERPVEGAYAAFIELDDRVAATAVYRGYGYFDSSVLHDGRGERGQRRPADTHAQTWAAYMSQTRPGERPGGDGSRREGRRLGAPQVATTPVASGDQDSAAHHYFGLTIVSCERGDITQQPDGIVIHDHRGARLMEISEPVSGGAAVLTELCDAVRHDEPPAHGVDWAALTVRTCLAIHESSASGAEVQIRRTEASAPR